MLATAVAGLAAATFVLHQPHPPIGRSVSSGRLGIQTSEAPCEASPAPLIVKAGASQLVLQHFAGATYQPPFALIARVVITNNGAITDLIAQIDKLPTYPCGTVFCPFDDGSKFQLDFSYPDGLTEEVTVHEHGCRGVYLLAQSKPIASADAAPGLFSTLIDLLNGQAVASPT
jgi:hypothetical protein